MDLSITIEGIDENKALVIRNVVLSKIDATVNVSFMAYPNATEAYISTLVEQDTPNDK